MEKSRGLLSSEEIGGEGAPSGYSMRTSHRSPSDHRPRVNGELEMERSSANTNGSEWSWSAQRASPTADSMLARRTSSSNQKERE